MLSQILTILHNLLLFCYSFTFIYFSTLDNVGRRASNVAGAGRRTGQPYIFMQMRPNSYAVVAVAVVIFVVVVVVLVQQTMRRSSRLGFNVTAAAAVVVFLS